MKKYAAALMLMTFPSFGMVSLSDSELLSSEKRLRKRTYSKIINIQEVCDDVRSESSYSKNLEELFDGIKEQNINKVAQALSFGFSKDELNKALNLLIRLSKSYDGTFKSIMKMLFDRGGDPNNLKGRIYSNLAVELTHHRNLDLLELLLKYGLDPNIKDENGDSPLQIAEKQNDYSQSVLFQKYDSESIRNVLTNRINKELGIIDLLRRYGTYNKFGDTLLIEAIINSEKFNIEKLLDGGTNINLPAANGLTPLMHAVFTGKLGIVKCLVWRGANVNLKNKDGKTALMIAAENNFFDIVQYLVSVGANVYEEDNFGETALNLALSHGSYDVADMLIDAGGAIRYQDRDFLSLFEAARSGHFNIVKYCIEHGFSINKKAKNGITPLMLASAYGHTDIVKYLLEKGADVCSQGGKNGYNALMFAVSNSNKDVVKVFIDYIKSCAKSEESKIFEKNVLERAVVSFYVNAEDVWGNNTLMIALKQGNKEIIEMLLEKGAYVYHENKNRETPISIERKAYKNAKNPKERAKHSEIIKMLTE